MFERQLRQAYSLSSSSFTFEECLAVFLLYFATYRLCKGEDHPHVKTDNLVKLLNDIDGHTLYDAGIMPYYFDPAEYPDMVTKYFDTYFDNCDGNICHFFSGKIRALRFFEACY